MSVSENFVGKIAKLYPLILITIGFGASLATSAVAAEGPLGLYVRDGVLMHDGRPYCGVGANYQTLIDNLLNNKDDNSTLDKLARLGQMGIPFVRFRANAFGIKNQELYLQNREEFFRRMDRVVQCAEKNHIGLIPSLFWRLNTVPETFGESLNQILTPSSKSNQFIRQFTRDMVSRYKDSPAIWGWEFGNEANLNVDLPGGRRGNGFSNSAGGALSSQELTALYVMFAKIVREIDPTRIIDSGATNPRPAAWHLAHGQGWRRDDLSQSLSMLDSLNPDPMDITSVHIYEKAKEIYPSSNGVSGIMALLTKEAQRTGKPLYVGEFPVQTPEMTDEFLHAIEVNRVPLSAFWVFDFRPGKSPWCVTFDNERSFVLDRVVEANKVLQSENAR